MGLEIFAGLPPIDFSPEPSPLKLDRDGIARVGGTRVTLMTVVEAFRRGSSPEQIALDFSLDTADAFHVIAYYLRRKQEVEQYWIR